MGSSAAPLRDPEDRHPGASVSAAAAAATLADPRATGPRAIVRLPPDPLPPAPSYRRAVGSSSLLDRYADWLMWGATLATLGLAVAAFVFDWI